jgi:transposase
VDRSFEQEPAKTRHNQNLPGQRRDLCATDILARDDEVNEITQRKGVADDVTDVADESLLKRRDAQMCDTSSFDYRMRVARASSLSDLRGLIDKGGMAARFVSIDRDTPLLLPPELRDWVPAGHLAHLIIDAVELLDLQQLKVNHRGTGSEQYPPRMLLALLIYSYATGTFGSRRIEQNTHDSVPVRLIAADTHPDHDTICAFRRETVPANSMRAFRAMVETVSPFHPPVQGQERVSKGDPFSRVRPWLCCEFVTSDGLPSRNKPASRCR